MENSADWELRNLINELTLGRELAKQLQIHMNAPSSSHESRELLVHKILNSYEKALNLVKVNATGTGVMGETQPNTTGVSESRSQQSTGITVGMSESPRSHSGSPRSEDSDRELRDHDLRDASRKRKSMPRWTRHVQVCPGTGLEGPLEDGFSWRKYGQKDILGAKYPRGYYRCSHRHVQGCLATKQVQRSDEDATIFEVTYRGRHTCNEGKGSESNPPPSALIIREKPEVRSQVSQPTQQNPQEILLSFQRGLKVEIKDIDTHNQEFPTFNFPSSTSTAAKQESYTFFPSVADNNVSGNLPPTFLPRPTTSGSNNLSVSPCEFIGYASESDFTDLISAATSTTNSPTVGIDFPLSQMEFDPNFTFDNSGFFS